jgi:hypothetical protein
MAHLAYQRTVIAYHGCDESVARRVLLDGEKLEASENDYDWLGHGIYFWEHGKQRALEWAIYQAKRRRKIRHATILGAFIHLGNCFDLLDTRNTALLSAAYPRYLRACGEGGVPVPRNTRTKKAASSDLVLRHLDCAVINWTITMREAETHERIQSVRGAFTEGVPAFEGSKVMSKSHIQIAVRDHGAIVGYFKPNLDNLPIRLFIS